MTLFVRLSVFQKLYWGVGGDVWRWLCRHVCRKISAHVDGGPVGVSSSKLDCTTILTFSNSQRDILSYSPSPMYTKWNNVPDCKPHNPHWSTAHIVNCYGLYLRVTIHSVGLDILWGSKPTLLNKTHCEAHNLHCWIEQIVRVTTKTVMLKDCKLLHGLPSRHFWSERFACAVMELSVHY